MSGVDKARTPPIVFRRYPVSHLCDVVYFVVPMTTELAETIRTQRRGYSIGYEKLWFWLCETDPDDGASFGLGKALTDIASRHLNDPDPAWT